MALGDWKLTKHETCLQYFRRRLGEGWKCVSLEGNNAVLLSPEGIRRKLDLRNDIETLRPNAGGDETNCQAIGASPNWQCVNEVTPNDDTDYVRAPASAWYRDLYNIPNSGVGAGTISKITLTFRCYSTYNNPTVMGAIKSDSTVTETAQKHAYADFYPNYGNYTQDWSNNPADGQPWEWSDINALQIGVSLLRNVTRCTQVYVEVDYASAIVAPTVTTQAAISVEATTATGNGNITDNGGENCDERGVEWGTDDGGPYPNSDTDTDSFGTGAFTKGMTGLPAGTTIYYRAKAHNTAGWGYGAQESFLTKPAAPTNVQATDGVHSDKVVITWTKSTGATGYQVYRDGTPLGWLGDVDTLDDTGAGAPSITPGDSVASDGDYPDKVSLSLSGTGTNNGTTHTYKVRSRNATGESADSGTNTGYRAPGALTYQWERSAADSDADYSDISGATTASYNDTGAPPGGGRYYKCRSNATGATEQTSSSDRGYREALSKPSLTAHLIQGDLI